MAKKSPYGNVDYADPGYQSDGVKRYPLDTKAHVKAAWSYINMPRNAKEYSATQLGSIKAKIKAAAKKFGITIDESESEFLDLAYRGVLTPMPERRTYKAQFETRSMGNGRIELTGYASTVNQPYRMYDMFGEYTETVQGGAFRETLERGADVSFLVNHSGMTLARTKTGSLRLQEDSTGLLSVAEIDERRSDGKDLLLAIDRGDIDEMSFGFRVVQQHWNEDYDQRTMVELDLNRGDVSAVNYGANPNTNIHAVQRAFNTVGAARVAQLAGELRSGATISNSTRQVLSQVLDLVANADKGVDQAQPLLANLLGVPNPDIKQDKKAKKLQKNMTPMPDEQESAFIPETRAELRRYLKSLA